MNTLVFLPEEISGDIAIVRGTRVETFREVHDLELEKDLPSSIFGGNRGRATLKENNADSLKFEGAWEVPPIPLGNIILIVAVPRPQTIKKVVYLGTSVGLSKIFFLKTDRGEKNYLTSKQLRAEVMQEEMLRALEQTGGSLVPEIEIFKSLNDGVSILGGNGLKLVADTAEKSQKVQNLKKVSHEGSVTIAIGPEKGWSPRELKLLKESNFQGVTLGERVFRVDVAALYLVAQVELLFGVP